MFLNLLGFLAERMSTVSRSCSHFPLNSLIVASSPSVVGRMVVVFGNIFLFVLSLDFWCFLP